MVALLQWLAPPARAMELELEQGQERRALTLVLSDRYEST